jgi:hypothetical protein
MRASLVYSTALTAILVIASPLTFAAKAGQSATIQYGKTIGKQQVDLNSAVPKGAVVGGALGLASASGKSSKKKARNALIGAAAGGAIAGGAQGSTKGMLYTIDLGPNGQAQVVTDQTEIVPGDCVAFEKAGETANIRRVSASYCEPANAAAVAAVADQNEVEADQCYEAKQMVVNATTAEEFEFAKVKMEFLCND